MAQQILPSNTFCEAKWVVSPTASQGTHTTIASALTSASSGDTIFILPSTYTENITLKAGVNLTAFASDGSFNQTGNVIISGKCTFTAAGSVTISGIQLQTNSDFALAVTGSAASVVNLINCNINCTNNTGISYSSSSGSSGINIYVCTGDLGTTGIALLSQSGGGTLNIRYSIFTNSGGSSTANTVSAGVLQVEYSKLFNPITSSSTAGVVIDACYLNTATQNVATFTCGGSGANRIGESALNSGSASTISIGATLTVANIEINSTNTNAITGAGTLLIGEIIFTGTSSTINTSTITSEPVEIGALTLNTALTVANGGTGVSSLAAYALVCGGTTTTGAFQHVSDVATGEVLISGGTTALPSFSATPTVTSITFGAGNALNTYTTGTWTPGVNFGGATTGITYSSQSGYYTQIGNCVFVNGSFTLSSKGSATGNANLTGLPVTAGANSPYQLQCNVFGVLTATATYTSFAAYTQGATTAANLYQSSPSAGGATAFLTNTNFANTTAMTFSGVYIVA